MNERRARDDDALKKGLAEKQLSALPTCSFSTQACGARRRRRAAGGERERIERERGEKERESRLPCSSPPPAREAMK